MVCGYQSHGDSTSAVRSRHSSPAYIDAEVKAKYAHFGYVYMLDVIYARFRYPAKRVSACLLKSDLYTKISLDYYSNRVFAECRIKETPIVLRRASWWQTRGGCNAHHHCHVTSYPK